MESVQPVPKTIALTCLTMIAFAANSLLTRAALGERAIDAASFTTIRLAAGAAALWVIVRFVRREAASADGDWVPAGVLFVYAIAFSLAYLSLAAGTGALIMFGAVQITMLTAGLRAGERFTPLSWLGFAVAVAGVAWLVSPGVTAPPPLGAALMTVAGITWGFYSLSGRRADPLLATAANFGRALPFALVASVLLAPGIRGSWLGVGLAVVCGAVTSGVGYVIWYEALKGLDASRAAIVQLSVPALAAVGGVLFLAEQPSWRLALCSVAILGGIAIVLVQRRAPRRA
jgi:drug/metabolite transporter (DMT)-like permease